MRERQRWQPEEDALLRAYVKQYGPKEWGMVSERVGRPLHRDPKSCQERWKNYLRPGLKKGSLSFEEQALVISLQSRYGNKWKAIAAHLPGRTSKLLGKWWEVFKEKQLKSTQNNAASTSPTQATTTTSSRSLPRSTCSIHLPPPRLCPYYRFFRTSRSPLPLLFLPGCRREQRLLLPHCPVCLPRARPLLLSSDSRSPPRRPTPWTRRR